MEAFIAWFDEAWSDLTCRFPVLDGDDDSMRDDDNLISPLWALYQLGVRLAFLVYPRDVGEWAASIALINAVAERDYEHRTFALWDFGNALGGASTAAFARVLDDPNLIGRARECICDPDLMNRWC